MTGQKISPIYMGDNILKNGNMKIVAVPITNIADFG